MDGERGRRRREGGDQAAVTSSGRSSQHTLGWARSTAVPHADCVSGADMSRVECAAAERLHATGSVLIRPASGGSGGVAVWRCGGGEIQWIDRAIVVAIRSLQGGVHL